MGIGAKRLAVGAHYGLKSWLLQRITAVIMAIYIVAFAGWLLFNLSQANWQVSFKLWANLFGQYQITRITTLLFGASLFYHAWVGIRDLWMDYIKSAGLRIVLHTCTALYLIGCTAYLANILWRI